MKLSEHLSDQQIRGYRQGSLAPAEVLAVGDHLALCAACRIELSNGDQLRRAFVAVSTDLQTAPDREPVHLTPELLAAYIDEQLDEVNRAIANRHLARCAECQAETFDLRGLRSMLAERPARSAPPVPTAPQWSRFAKHVRPPSLWIAAQAAAIALLVVWVAMIPLRTRIAGLTGQISELQQRNQSLEQRPTSPDEMRDRAGEPEPSSVETLATSAPIVALNDRDALVTIDAQGRLTGLDSLPEAYKEMIKAALRDQRIKTPLIAELTGKRGVLMGVAPGDQSFSLLGPIGGATETDRPTFSWRPLSGAKSYSVRIYDGASNQVAASLPISETRWTPPQALGRGAIYAWEVTAVRDDKEVTSPAPPAPPAKFKVLDAAKLGELTRARGMYRGSHLILGVISAQFGLLDEAERELNALVAANPDSITARNLLRSVKSLRTP